jgi:predicted branched-subunit amino acid permease
LLADPLLIWGRRGRGATTHGTKDLATALTFLLLLLPTLKDRPGYIAAGVAGAVAVPATGLPLGLGTIFAATAGILAGAITERTRHA